MIWRTREIRLVLCCSGQTIFSTLMTPGSMARSSAQATVTVLCLILQLLLALPTVQTQPPPSVLASPGPQHSPYSIYFSPSSPEETCEFDDVRRARDKVIRIGVILPMYDRDFIFGLMYTGPAFEIAREEILRSDNLLKGYSIEFDYRDSNCSDVYGPLEGIDMYANREVDLFIGPFCDYAVAPLARFASMWEIPIMTAGGLVEQLSDKVIMYRLLTRMTAPYGKLAECLVDILKSFGYRNIGMILHQWKDPNKTPTDQWFTLEAIFLLIQSKWNPGISMEYAKTFDMYDYTRDELESHLIELSNLCRGERSHGVTPYI